MVEVNIVLHGVIRISVVRERQCYIIYTTITIIVTRFSRVTKEVFCSVIVIFQRNF